MRHVCFRNFRSDWGGDVGDARGFFNFSFFISAPQALSTEMVENYVSIAGQRILDIFFLNSNIFWLKPGSH